MKENEELPRCKCGCSGRVTKPGNKYIVGHNNRSDRYWKSRRELQYGSQLCECGCGGYTKPGNRFINGHNGRKPKPDPQLCECGCGDYAKPGNRFISGHQTKNRPSKNRKSIPEPQLCECGCGDYAEPGNRFIYTHNTRGKNHPMYGKNQTEKSKQKIRDSQPDRSGENNQFYGKHHTEASKQKRLANMPDQSGENNPFFGKHHTEETKQEMTIIKKDKPLSKEHCRKISVATTGENNPNWRGGLSFGKYCHLFNNKFKEIIRNLYNRRCFLCGKTEKENGKRHDVHHVNYDKNCLCGVLCEFVPLCHSCHMKTNFNRKYWEDLIMCYLYPERYFIVDI